MNHEPHVVSLLMRENEQVWGEFVETEISWMFWNSRVNFGEIKSDVDIGYFVEFGDVLD